MPFLKNSVGRSDIFLIFVLFIFSFDILYEKLDQNLWPLTRQDPRNPPKLNYSPETDGYCCLLENNYWGAKKFQ